MWVYVIRRLLVNLPVFLGIVALVMAALRVQDPIWAYLGKNATQEMYDSFAANAGLDRSFIVRGASGGLCAPARRRG